MAKLSTSGNKRYYRLISGNSNFSLLKRRILDVIRGTTKSVYSYPYDSREVNSLEFQEGVEYIRVDTVASKLLQVMYGSN